MLVTSLFVIARNWKQPKYPPARRMDKEIFGWPNKQIQLSIKRNELLTHAVPRISLSMIVLSKRNQTKIRGHTV